MQRPQTRHFVMINVHLMCGLVSIPVPHWHIPSCSLQPRQRLVDLRSSFALHAAPFCPLWSRTGPTDVFNSTAKPFAVLMSLCHDSGNKHIRIHDGTTDLRDFFTYSPAFTGTSMLSVPLESIANDRWTSTVRGVVKPFSQAQYICSMAFLRLPGYRGAVVGQN